MFYALAEVQLLDNSIYRAIADRVYLFIGVIALFMLSSSLLKALVNPDEINKGVIKSFKSLITSVILVVLIPTIFKYAFSMQSAILSDNIIGKIFQIDLNKFKETGESPITNSSDSMYEVCNFETEPEKGVVVKDSSGKDSLVNSEITHNECQGNYITLTILEAFLLQTIVIMLKLQILMEHLGQMLDCIWFILEILIIWQHLQKMLMTRIKTIAYPIQL